MILMSIIYNLKSSTRIIWKEINWEEVKENEMGTFGLDGMGIK